MHPVHQPTVKANIQSVNPNPAAESAVIQFTLQQEAQFTIEIVDISGKRLWVSASENLPAGTYTRPLAVSALPAGTYGVVLTTRHGKTGTLLVKK